MKSVLEIARDLVAIPSVNPDGGDPGTERTGEAECAAWVRDFLGRLGADVRLEEVLPGRPNVVARFPNGAGRRLLLAPHLDTVSVAGMTIDPFAAEVRDGRLWGRGASDTKGPAAAMLWALAACHESLSKAGWEVWFAGLAGEEAGQPGARHLAATEAFDFVIAGEPTDLKIVHAHKGCSWLALRTFGRSVHASRPESGENAIDLMTEVLRRLHTDCKPRLQEHTHPLLGGNTMSVGTIRGGSKVNIVPDHCEAEVDFRLVPGSDVEWIPGFLESHFPGLQTELRSSLPLHTDPSHPAITLLRSLGAGLGTAPWFCDAAVFAAAGCASVAMGPGSIAQAHTADEFIDIASLEEGSRFFQRFLESL